MQILMQFHSIGLTNFHISWEIPNQFEKLLFVCVWIFLFTLFKNQNKFLITFFLIILFLFYSFLLGWFLTDKNNDHQEIGCGFYLQRYCTIWKDFNAKF